MKRASLNVSGVSSEPLGLEAMRDIPHTIETIEGVYNFTSDAGPLTKCGEWNYLKRILASLQLPEAEIQSSDGANVFAHPKEDIASIPLSAAEPFSLKTAAEIEQERLTRKRLSEANSTAAMEGVQRELEQLREWKASVLSKCKHSDGWDALKWAGDKEGWGFVHYFIGHLNTRATTLREVNPENTSTAFSDWLWNKPLPSIAEMSKVDGARAAFKAGAEWYATLSSQPVVGVDQKETPLTMPKPQQSI